MSFVGRLDLGGKLRPRFACGDGIGPLFRARVCVIGSDSDDRLWPKNASCVKSVSLRFTPLLTPVRSFTVKITVFGSQSSQCRAGLGSHRPTWCQHLVWRLSRMDVSVNRPAS
ncbi:hypothetical protein F2Q70_00013581 [Brassica cretica]|uniref:Uncharacterized protein n=1 Tax=Brassica cretica TaxID=69181 RepID=A0A8S9M839_BRACR|nr:hypothetical protein F2Q70_00013581 [Brassica cretica]